LLGIIKVINEEFDDDLVVPSVAKVSVCSKLFCTLDL